MRKLLLLLVLMLGGSLVLLGIGIFFYNAALQNPGTVSIPTEITDEALYLQQSGWRAMDEFSRLHQQDFPLTAGSIGTYGADQDIKLWVGETFLEIMAGKMIVDMRDKIANGSSPFRPNGERQIDDRIIYALDGMGQRHFYFQSGKLIVWLAADENIAEQALYEILEYFP
jgi:hypothetical protein